MPHLAFEDENWRKSRIDEFLNPENVARKREHLKRFECFQSRQHPFVVTKLKREFGEKALSEMRLITSINVTKRFVNSQASIYCEEPNRVFEKASESEKILIADMYEAAEVNKKMKKGNKVFKLHDQGCIQVWPNKRKNIIDLRVLRPHQYDVIPWPDSPEIAAAYIINVFDKSELITQGDEVNQVNADSDDYKRTLMRFVWWTDLFNFMTNGNGEIVLDVDPKTGEPVEVNINPIGRLPFVDLHFEKEFEFWIRQSSDVVSFSIDLAAIWSDFLTISKMQGYAQAVLTGSVQDTQNNFKTGPLHLLILTKAPDSDSDPKFEFVNPQPDLKGSLEGIQMLINNFMTSQGEDVDLVTGSPTGGQRFSSALERMLAQIDKFKATKDDFDVMESAEVQVFMLLRDWNNVVQEMDFLKDELKLGKITENVFVTTTFAKPESIQTKQEKEDGINKRFDNNWITRIEGHMEMRNIDKTEAEKVEQTIQDEKKKNVERVRSMMGTPFGGNNADSKKDVQPKDDVRDGDSDGASDA